MVHDRASWRMKTRRAAVALSAAASLFAALDVPALHAQSIMRTPNLSIESRVPTINPTVAPRIDPNIAGRTGNIAASTAGRTTPRISVPTSAMRPMPRIGVTSTLPSARYSPNRYPACGSESDCRDRQGSSANVSADGGGSGGAKSAKNRNGNSRRNAPQTALNPRTVANQLVAEIDGALSDAQADELARRYRLERIASQSRFLAPPLACSASPIAVR